MALKLALFGLTGSFPDVLWDGFVNSEKTDANGHLESEFAICIDDETVEVLNADLANDSDNITTDSTQHRCKHAKIPPVVLATTVN